MARSKDLICGTTRRKGAWIDMYCPACGERIEEGSAFCPCCGASASDPSPQASPQEAAFYLSSRRARRERMRKEADEAYREACFAEDELKRLRGRRLSCLVATIILGFAAAQGSWAYFSGLPDLDAQYAAFGTANLTFVFAAFPFGFMPLKDFAMSHGFAIVFTVAFAVLLFAFVLMFTTFAAIPYFLYLQSKIGAAKREVRTCHDRVESIAAALD